MSLVDYNSISDTLKQEPNDWPQALLAIGTFGNNKLKEEHQKDDHHHDLHCSDHLTDFTVEEVNRLQKELKKLLIRKSKSRSSTGADIVEEDKVNLPLNRFLNFPSSLEVDRTARTKFESLEDESNGDLSPNTKIVLQKLKNMLLGNHNVIKKKPISFLLKKMFVCSNGFTPAPSLRDLIPESRMDKILRAILTKVVHQQNSAPISSKNYLENKPKEQAHEQQEEGRKKTKWVKTDSEFIVLEI